MGINEETTKDKKGKKKKIIIGVGILCIIALAGTGAWYYFYVQNQTKGEMGRPGGAMSQELDGVVTASGTTMVGMEEEKFELEELDTDLVIEEVYVSNGDEVEAGSRILKITDESLESARKLLEREQNRTELLYRQSAATIQNSLNDAKQEYEVSLIETEYAQSEYESALQQEQEAVSKLEEALEDAQELYEEYYDGINNNGYYEEYEVAEKKALYETNEALYWATLKSWNIKDEEVNNSSAESAGTQGQPGGNSNSAANSDKQQRITALELIEDLYRAEKESYEQAMTDCDNAVKKAQAGIDAAKAAYDLAALELEQGKLDYEKKAATCLADYETAAAKGSAAQTTYDTQVQKLQEELNTLQNDWESAEENLQVFEEAIGDGYLYTGSKGTIMMVMVSEENNLEPDALVLAYTNPDIIQVNASVDQTDIASVELGESAVVMVNDGGSYEGTVTTINPVTNSNSKAAVTYSVEITLTGDLSEVSENQTVTAYIGITLEELQEKTEQMQKKQVSGNVARGSAETGTTEETRQGAPDGIPSEKGFSEDGELPDGMERPADGNIQAGDNMPAGGNS